MLNFPSKNKRLNLWQYLTHQRKKRRIKGGRKVYRGAWIPGSASIEQRPKEVEYRLTSGHWETDNVIGKMSDDSALSVTVERFTRLTILSRLPAKGATEKANLLLSRLNHFPKRVKLTLTTDKGIENSFLHRIIFKIQMQVYFCHAYASWEKGTVENTNGRIRRYIPKGLSIDQVTEKQVKELEIRLNSTPRKCLNYLTPYEKMKEVLS